jgi:ketosteroid isomerase-like protein
MMYLQRLAGALALAATFGVSTAFAQSTEDAGAAVEAWLDAVLVGTPEALSAVLAPEFQIQRANGTGHDRAGYIEGGAAQLAEFSASDLIVTRYEDILVVRYTLVVSETIDGQPVERTAPRLTVFRYGDGRWLVVAHANFAEVQQ